MPLLKYMTHISGTTTDRLAAAAGLTVPAVRARLRTLEAEGKAVRRRGAVGKPHIWWRKGNEPLDSLTVLLVMALAAKFHPPAKLRKVLHTVSTRVDDPVGRSVLRGVKNSRNPHAVVARAVEYHFEDET